MIGWKRFLCLVLTLCMSWGAVHAASDGVHGGQEMTHHHTSDAVKHQHQAGASDDNADTSAQDNHCGLHACSNGLGLVGIDSVANDVLAHERPSKSSRLASRQPSDRIERPQWATATVVLAVR